MVYLEDYEVQDRQNNSGHNPNKHSFLGQPNTVANMPDSEVKAAGERSCAGLPMVELAPAGHICVSMESGVCGEGGEKVGRICS